MTKIPWLIPACIFMLAACSPAAPATPAANNTPLPNPTAEASATPAPSDTPAPTVTPVPTLGVGSTFTSPVDGMVLVYVPQGSFLMGSPATDGSAYPDEMPQHSVTLDAFWIDRTEVTNGEYAQCAKAKACPPPARITSNVHDLYYGNATFADYPVLWVNWDDANAYCQWAGRRLPTEAEWEKAARGTDGRIYPWGNTPPDPTLLNFNHANKVKDIVQVGSYPNGASPYGALDMAGNVFEWVADWYGVKYYGQSPDQNPKGPDTGTQRVLRGGSWQYDAAGVRSAYRYQSDPSVSSYEFGFRCVTNQAP